MSLSVGKILQIYHGDQTPGYIFQVLDIKKMQSNNQQNAQERFRVVISDGTHYVQAMLATQANYLIHQNVMSKGALVQLQEYITNDLHDRKVIILLRVDVVAQGGDIIGAPANVESSARDPSSQQQQQHQPQQQHPPQQQQQRMPNNSAPQNSMGAQQQQRSVPQKASAPKNFIQQQQQQYQQQHQPQQNQMGSYHQQPQSYQNMNRGGGLGGNQEPIVIPIRSLNPYSNRWTLKARVTNKTDIKEFESKAGNRGKLFSVDLLDATGGEIRATFFNDAVTNLYHEIQKDKVYFFSRGTLKTANKKFSTIKNEFELNFDASAAVSPADDDDTIPRSKLSYIGSIDAIQNNKKDDIVDLLGIIYHTGDLENIKTKKEQTYEKRTVLLVDRSGFSIALTLWGKQAQNLRWSESDHPVVSVRGVKVSDFANRTLTAVSSTTIEPLPDTPEAHQLRGWWETEGHTKTFTPLTRGGYSSAPSGPVERKLMAQIKEEHLAFKDQADFLVKATISYIKKDNLIYPACPECGKKANALDQHNWTCPKCTKQISPIYKFMMSLSAYDHTGVHYLTSFDSSAPKILKRSANEIANERNSSNSLMFDSTIANAQHQMWMFTLRAKLNDNSKYKLQCTVQNVEPVNFVEQSNYLLEQINLLMSS